MAEQLDLNTFTGAHPNNKQFAEQLQAWGFTQRRPDGVHLVYRGPHGGTVRVLRSLLGRADAALVEKAARLARVDVAQFWAGPGSESDEPGEDSASEADEARPRSPGRESGRRRSPANRDRIISLVLGAHTSTDRPLGFDQVVALCRGRVTRAQVQNASAALCQDGHLDRIRQGVYQWAGGARAISPTPPMPYGATSYVVPPPRRQPDAQPTPASPQPRAAEHPTAVKLFDQMFPDGVRMTAELLADFEQWAQLTEKLAAYADAS